MIGLFGTRPSAPLNGRAKSGFWPDYDQASNIVRLRDRVFIGDAASFSGTWDGSDNPGTLPRWTLREACVAVVNHKGRVAITGQSKASSSPDTPSGSPNVSIGVIGFSENDKVGGVAVNSWGGYFEAFRRASVTNAVFGIEIDVGNLGADRTDGPYDMFGSGCFGLNIAAGGSTGLTYTNPSSSAIQIAKNGQTFNSGIVFGATAIQGTDGVTGTGTAIIMARGHNIKWEKSDGVLGAAIRSDVSTSASDVSIVFVDDAIRFFGEGNIIAQVDAVDSAVNYVRLVSAATGGSAELRAGGETNVDLLLAAKGSGEVRFGTRTADSDSATTGYITIKDAGGTTRRLAVIN